MIFFPFPTKAAWTFDHGDNFKAMGDPYPYQGMGYQCEIYRSMMALINIIFCAAFFLLNNILLRFFFFLIKPQSCIMRNMCDSRAQALHSSLVVENVD